ncbi:ATPase inhibitor [Rhodotorula kratochvilovae]
MPSGHSNDSFKKREKGQEDAYVRDTEREKLKALRKSIEASKAHLAELEKSHGELEASLGGEGAKKQ